MVRIYTRSGDDGMTSLGEGDRVSKDCLPLDVCGTLDELNSLLGVAMAEGVVNHIHKSLHIIQSDLFTIGSEIAYPKRKHTQIPHFTSERIEAMERDIDDLSDSLPTLRNFILPGGSKSAAVLHLARAVCRRAERVLVKFSQQMDLNPLIFVYMNRLSDLLFVMARYENMREEIAETVWKSSI